MVDAQLRERYYNAALPGSFDGADALSKATGINIKKTKDWLSNEMTYTLHKQAPRHYTTRPYRTNKIDAQWQADIVEMQDFKNVNNDNRYLLMVIHIFSRYAWARPLLNKEAKTVIAAFESILEQGGRRSASLQTNEGKEFDNRHFRTFLNENNMKFFVIHSEFKASLVERLNRTIKDKMYKYFTFTGSRRWIEVLPQLIKSYNASVHRSIGIAPRDVNRDNEMELWEKQQSKGPQQVGARKDVHPRFRVDDNVRTSYKKQVFDKGYLPTWTD